MLVKKIYGKITSKNNKYPLVKCTDFKFRNKDRIIKNIYCLKRLQHFQHKEYNFPLSFEEMNVFFSNCCLEMGNCIPQGRQM